MVLLCTLVQTALGPTPRNKPQTPSVLKMSRKPLMMEDVSRVVAECCLREVEGDDVEIGRFTRLA